ncbi:unnamed protein product [Linum tenue]|uniref:Guanine nucleotide-binding protein subunit gamma 3-like n=1 Tax=Linum tenue TaxID=586396 RepID=A0AAV0PR25_9ROSI|nr:unnamed protein product [Linum tenue]
MENGRSLKSCSSSSGASSSGSSSSVGVVVVGPVSPKSPPSGSLDMYGKRRQLVKVQVLEREIALLQEELKAVDVLQPASKCCREVHEYVDGRQDPFISKKEESHLLHKPCLSWKQLCRPWGCCLSECQCHVRLPKCLSCCTCRRRQNSGRRQSGSDSNSNANCSSCWGKPTCKRGSCNGCCLMKKTMSCLSCSNCTKVNGCCPSCSNNCRCCCCYKSCCCL